jgi:hypothetical protein
LYECMLVPRIRYPQPKYMVGCDRVISDGDEDWDGESATWEHTYFGRPALSNFGLDGIPFPRINSSKRDTFPIAKCLIR